MDLYTQLNSDLGDCYKLKNKRLVPSGADLNNYEDERDFIWRQPFRKLRKRPIYANPKERTKLTFSKKR